MNEHFKQFLLDYADGVDKSVITRYPEDYSELSRLNAQLIRFENKSDESWQEDIEQIQKEYEEAVRNKALKKIMYEECLKGIKDWNPPDRFNHVKVTYISQFTSGLKYINEDNTQAPSWTVESLRADTIKKINKMIEWQQGIIDKTNFDRNRLLKYAKEFRESIKD